MTFRQHFKRHGKRLGTVLTALTLLVGLQSLPVSPAQATGSTFTAGTPTVSGTAVMGGSLTADPGTWTPTPESVSYQWLRDTVAVSGETNDIYRLGIADVGHKLSVRVTATKSGYTDGTATSAQTASVAAGAPATLTAFTAKAVTISTGSCIAIPLTATYQVAADQAWSVSNLTLSSVVKNKHGKRIGVATLTGSGPNYTPRGTSVRPNNRAELIGTATGSFRWCARNDLGAIRFAAPSGRWTGDRYNLAVVVGGSVTSTLTASAHVRAGVRLGVPRLTTNGATKTLTGGFRVWVPSQKAWQPIRGSKVTVQKLVGSTWVKVTTVKISVKGKVKASWKASAAASYRMVWPGNGTKVGVITKVITG